MEVPHFHQMKGGIDEMVWHNNIWNEMNRLQRRMDRIFGSNWSDTESDKEEMIDELSTGYRRAFANFKETDNEFVIHVEVPGIDKENIQLNITETGLEIKAEKKEEKEKGKKDGKEYSYTKSYAGFYQAFDVPDNANLEHVDASYKNGVLVIRLPKKVSAKDKKTIQIK